MGIYKSDAAYIQIVIKMRSILKACDEFMCAWLTGRCQKPRR